MSLSNIQSSFSSPDPDIAYFRIGGTGNGTQNHPYGPNQGQLAYDRGFKYFDIGANVDIGTVITGPNEEVFVRGAGKNSKVYFASRGNDIIIWDMAGISCYIAVASYDNLATIDSGDIVIHYGYVILADSKGISGITDGTNAGNITLHGPMAVAQSVDASGGNGYNEFENVNPYNGGNAGIITIGPGVKFLSSAILIAAAGGLPSDAGGDPGADGAIILRGCDTGTVIPDAGAGGTITRIGAIENGVFYAS